MSNHTSDDEISFGPIELLQCYANGIFPMSDGPNLEDLYLVDPTERGVFPLDNFKISRSLAKVVRAYRFEVRVNSDFEQTIKHCANPDRVGAWISNPIIDLYSKLHEIEHAHSVEVWQGDTMVGGLYGVSLGGAFFGESMFSHQSNVSKIALVHLVGRLKAGGFSLLDAQFITEHLQSLGAIEIPRAAYHKNLKHALSHQGNFMADGFDDENFAQRVQKTIF